MNRKRLIAIAVAALMLIAAAGLSSAGTVKTMVLTVPDLSPANVNQALSALEDLDGVESVKYDLDETTLTVTYDDDAVGLSDFRDALDRVGLYISFSVDGY